MKQHRFGGRYELQAIIGHGGTAEVWRAVDVRLGRVVAVKVLRTDLADDPSFPERLRREARSVAQLNHPGIVDVYDAGSEQVNGVEVPYVVMEHVTGRTLRDLLVAGERLTPDHAMQITVAVLDALEYSHRAGIVHRDIKPGNVMLTDFDSVKVMDFGIARVGTGPAAELTGTSEVIGTARYLSPEQAMGNEVDGRSDIYSTGCLLYELLTGRPPFLGESPVGVALLHVRAPVEPPQEVEPELPEHYAAIVMRALAKDPSERYQSAGEMRDAISAALLGPPVPVRSRGRAPAYFLTAAGVAAAVAGAAYLVGAWSSPDAVPGGVPGTGPTPISTVPAKVGGAPVSTKTGSDSGESEERRTPDPADRAASPSPASPAPRPSGSVRESASPPPTSGPSSEPSPEPSSEPSNEPSESPEPSEPPEPSESPKSPKEPTPRPSKPEPTPPAEPTTEASPESSPSPSFSPSSEVAVGLPEVVSLK